MPMVSSFLFALSSIIVALGPPAVLSRFDSITFSPVQQCGNFTVLFAGGQPPTALPLSLTVVPFNSTPIVIEIEDSSWSNITFKGAAVTFLPFPAGTEFVASLDDATGTGAASVSDVIKIQPSHNESCLGNVYDAASAERYTVDQPISQCEEFNVTYDPSLVGYPPAIRAFSPGGLSFAVNESSVNSYLGQATYTLDAIYGQKLTLMLSDSTGFREATGLLTVGGNMSSPTTCLSAAPTVTDTPSQVPNKANGTSQNHQARTGMSHAKLSKPAAIAIAVVTAAVVGSLAVAMVMWLCREQRRIRKERIVSFEESFTIITDKHLDTESTGVVESEDMMTPTQSYYSPPPSSPPRIPLPKTPPPVVNKSRLSDISQLSPSSKFDTPAFVKDPLYTDSTLDLLSPMSTRFDPRRGLSPKMSASRTAPLMSPIPTRGSLSVPATLEVSILSQADATRSRVSSISSDDIEHILDMATMYSGPSTPASISLSTEYRDSMSVALIRPPPRPQSLSPLRTNHVLAMLEPPPSAVVLSDAASLRREPPQAPLPSSPLPSPSISRYFRPSDSIASGGDRSSYG